jgi:hypothetical protein
MNVETPVRPQLIGFEISCREALIEDVSHIVRCAPFIARYPARLFSPGLASELAEAVDILNCKVAELREAEDAGR